MPLRLIVLTLAAAAAFQAAADDGGPPQYVTHEEGMYGVRILVPQGWKKTTRDLETRRIAIFTRGAAEISLTSMPADEENKAKWNDWRNWYTGHGGAMKIIEDLKVSYGGTLTGTLSLFEYSRGRARILKKMLILQSNTGLHVLECSAPVDSYRHYYEIFTVVTGSLKDSK